MPPTTAAPPLPRKELSHEIVVDRPADEAMRLFTPRGEEGWVPGWKPAYVRPESGETCEEMIFATGQGEEKTWWTCLAWEPARLHVRYLRLTPASRVAFVDVRCKAEAAGRTRVRVAYEMQALTEHGRSHLDGLTREAFARSIDEWSGLIAAAG